MIYKNTLIQGDCLDVMNTMPDGCIDLVATDPPFNTGRDFGDFNDQWKWDDEIQKHYDQLDQAIKTLIVYARNAHSESIAAFLVYMAVRLLSMHRILKPTGSIYLHCDHTASHYLKAMMDAIFGVKQFENEVVWAYEKWTNTANYFQRNHDILLFYTKSKKYTFNKLYGNFTKNQEQILRAGYNAGSNKGKKIVRVYDKNKIPKDKFDYWNAEGRTIYYVNKINGKAISDVWPMPILSGGATERTGYKTQKPVALYERIIKASSNVGDVVLDPFCGCATTLVAAEKNERQWVGIDVNPEAIEIGKKRLKNIQF